MSSRGTCAVGLLQSDDVVLFDLAANREVARHHQEGVEAERLAHYQVADDCRVVLQEPFDYQTCVSRFDGAFVGRQRTCFQGRYETFTHRTSLAASGSRWAFEEWIDSTVQNVRVFDSDGQEVFVQSGWLATPLLSDDGESVAYQDANEGVRVVDLATRKTRSVLPASNSARPIAFSPRGDRLVLLDEGMAMFDVPSRRMLWRHAWVDPGPYHSVQFSADGESLVYLTHGAARVVDASTGEDRAEPRGFFDLRTAAFTNDGAHVVTSSLGYLSVWSATSCGFERATVVDGDLVHLLAVPKSSDMLALHRGPRDTIVKYGADTGNVSRASFDDVDVAAMAVAPDGSGVALWHRDVSNQREQELVFVDLTSMEIARRVALQGLGSPRELLFSPDGARLILIADHYDDNDDDDDVDALVVKQLSVATGTVLKTREIPAGRAGVVALLDQGRTLHLAGSTIAESVSLDLGTGKTSTPAARLVHAANGVGVWETAAGLVTLDLDEPWSDSIPTSVPRQVRSGDFMDAARTALLQCHHGSCALTRR